MFRKSLNKQKLDNEVTADMTPMLDIVFILLIFFVVTTSFIKAEALDLTRPSSSPKPCLKKCPQPIVVVIDDKDSISINDRIIDTEALEANILTALQNSPNSSILIRINESASHEVLVKAVDQSKLAGSNNITVSKW